MKARGLTAFAMLAVYLMSICGAAAIVLSCHCSHSHYMVGNRISTCGCHSCLDGLAFAESDSCVESACVCLHDHSTDIALYSADDYRPQSLAPAVSDCITASADEADIATKIAKHTYNIRGDLPLPVPPQLSACGLRAPPVFA